MVNESLRLDEFVMIILSYRPAECASSQRFQTNQHVPNKTPKTLRNQIKGYHYDRSSIVISSLNLLSCAYGVRKDLASEVSQHPRFVGLRELLENGVDTLSPRVSHRAQSVSSNRACNRAWEIRDDETHGTAAQAADEAPELARRLRLVTLGHALFTEHLLEHVAELLVAEALAVIGGRGPSVVVCA